MEINIAGAGAGKTTKMSDKIILLRNQIDAEKKIFCVAFTNSAVDCIRRKLCEHYVQIPENIIVSTIHSFLYREIIKPYANYIPGKNSSELRKLFISFLKKQNGKFNFDEPCALIQFDAFKRFYINELGKLARYYFELIEHKARDINTYTYEIDSYSNAARVFLSTQRRSFYEQMVIEQNSIKELLLYMYKNKRESGVFRLLNDMESLEMDDALVNDYLADLCEGKVNNWLIDYVDELYEEMEDIKKRKERKELLALIGNRSVLFDFDDFEDDENESYHKNMFESDDIEGGENL